MRKEKLFIALSIAACALSFSGCKKREAIDLSSLHTTAAVEKETLPESTKPAEETTEESSAGGTNDGAAAFSLKTEIKKETVGNATVEYPVISNMKDSEKQKQANALLKTNALAIADVHPDQTLSVKATVESINLKRITVTYKGELKNPSSGKNERLFFANTVDLETIQNLGLGDFTDAYTMAGYIASGDCKLSDVSGNESAVKSAIVGSDKTVDYYYKKLQAADFTGGYTEDENKTPAAAWPEIFSYEKQGVVYVSLPVSSDLGGYVLIHYSPDNK